MANDEKYKRAVALPDADYIYKKNQFVLDISVGSVDVACDAHFTGSNI